MAPASIEPANVAGTALDRYFHICAFFDSRDEEYSALSSYYREGLESNEKALHIVEADLCGEHRNRLGAMGIDVARCEHEGRLQVMTPAETYLIDGCFDPDKMLVNVDEIISTAKAQGYRRTRIMGKMSWALEGAPGSERLIEYEARVNEVLSRTCQPAICVYDATRLTGGMMLDILRCHPLTLVNGVVHENPYFTPPEQFLSELEHRKRRATAAE
jgi:DcmR-like sensory protein